MDAIRDSVPHTELILPREAGSSARDALCVRQVQTQQVTGVG